MTGPSDGGRTTVLAGPPGHQLTRTLDGPPIGRRAARQDRRFDTGGGPGDPALLAQDRRRRGLIGLVTVLVVAVLLGGAGWWFTWGPGAYQTLPSLQGLTLAEAQQRLNSLGLHAEQQNRHDDTAQPGTVIDTNPTGGQQVRDGGTVVLVLCDGPNRVTVPPITGATLDQAVAQLQRSFLKPATDRIFAYDDTAPKNTVISANPSPGTQVDNGSTVQLTISNGPQPVDLPDMTGRQQDDAINQLQQLGFKPVLQQANSDTVPQGMVISQDPQGGQGRTAGHGASVTLVVSQGPQLVEVPNVFGKQVPEATKTLEEAGFKVAVNRLLGGVFGTVRAQDPGAGSRAPKGSTVNLTVV